MMFPPFYVQTPESLFILQRLLTPLSTTSSPFPSHSSVCSMKENGELGDPKQLGWRWIHREACRIILSFKKIFFDITVALIFPISIIYLAEMPISDLLFGKIRDDDSTLAQVLVSSMSSERALYQLFKVAYFVFLVTVSLFSTSAVIYTVVSIYIAKPITFKKVMSVVHRIWKGLLVRFFWNCIILVVCDLVLQLCVVSLGKTSFLGSLVSLLMVGMVYISVIWQLANVMSMLEGSYGLEAMKKSKGLIKGKILATCFLCGMRHIITSVIDILVEELVVDGDNLALAYRVIIGIGCFFLTAAVFLYGLVVQTVIYFVCKSYHHQKIDIVRLAGHLDGFMVQKAH